MREIKFRGKRADSGEWVYGNYHYRFDEAPYIDEWKRDNGNQKLVRKNGDGPLSIHWILVPRTPHDSGWDIKDTFQSYKILPETVGQYTGLIDKGIKQIYEGDIVECHDHPTGVEDTIGVVEFRHGFYNVNGTPLHDYGTAWTQIIGNIYEHPSLIQP